jgi:hypothetical protein
MKSRGDNSKGSPLVISMNPATLESPHGIPCNYTSVDDRQAVSQLLGERNPGQAGNTASAVLLTNCPSCLQGLGRNVHTEVKPRHAIVAIARRLSGDRWPDILCKRAAAAQAIHS